MGVGFQTSPLLYYLTLFCRWYFLYVSRLYYVIDIYQRIKQNITLWNSLFVSYFPLLVAGPIEERPIYCHSKSERSLILVIERGVFSLYGSW
jgi:D-alanyl-lipoteichoic acid acyltransferase DltB (MBOAT superfamily)